MILSVFNNFKKINILVTVIITAAISLSGCSGSDSKSASSPYSGYANAVEGAFFEVPGSLTGVDSSSLKKTASLNKASASDLPGGVIDDKFPSQIPHKYMRGFAGLQVDLMEVYKEIALNALSDLRIFEKPGTSYESTVTFSWDPSSIDIVLTAYDDSSNGDYEWKIVMAAAEDPDNPFFFFRLKVDGETVKGSIRTYNDESDEEDTAVVFVDGASSETVKKYCKKYLEINFEKTGAESLIECKNVPDAADLDSIRVFLDSNSKFSDNSNDKMKKNVMGADDNPTDKGEGPSYTFVRFTKDDQYFTMAAMFYFPLIEEYPNLYYFNTPEFAGKEVCSWAFRGKAITATDLSRVDLAYPYSESDDILWNGEHTVAARFGGADWLNVTNSALFGGYNHFIGIWDGINFYEYDAALHILKEAVTGASVPVTIESLTSLGLDDIYVPSTMDVKEMIINFE